MVRSAVPEPLRLALTLTLLVAVSVSTLALQATLSLTLMSPVVPLVPLALVIVTLPLRRLLETVVPVMSPPVAAMVKSVGSSSQVPACPWGARVVTRAVSAILSWDAEVSMKPPSPPWSAPLALSAPSTCVLLPRLARSAITSMRPPVPALPGAASAVMLLVGASSIVLVARRRITPPSLTSPVAEMLPLFLTTPPSKLLAACADKMTRPPGACTALPFSTSVLMVLGVTNTLLNLLLLLICSW